MKELNKISLGLLILFASGCSIEKQEGNFIKSKELLCKIEETINFIETKHNNFKYISLTFLTNKDGGEYIRIQSEANINNMKLFYQEKYKGKTVIVLEASDSLLNKYFDVKYKKVNEVKYENEELLNYENIGYILKVNKKTINIDGIIGWKVPEEIETYRNFRIKEILPPIDR
jgi:hypothetical protein